MKETVEARIATLREEIRRHDHLYFVENNPQISDEQYDRLVAELKSLEALHPELITSDSPTQRVGERPLSGFQQVRHRIPMLSIDNTYSAAEVLEFDVRVRRLLETDRIEYVVEPKIDGVAVSLRYDRGLLTRGVTRGDGETGDEITQNIRAIRSVPLRLRSSNWPEVFEVRGEVYWPRPAFEEVNRRRIVAGEPAFANPRNATAGTLKQLDARLVAPRGLAFMAHGIGEIEPPLRSAERYTDILARLREWGIPTSPHTRVFQDVHELIDFIQRWDAQRRSLDYDTDGLVIKVDRLDYRDRLGTTSKSPRWCIAFKYAAEQAQTVLESVDFQVGKLGTITPVANLRPVLLAGTTVRRATLHNFEQVERLDLHIGDTVTIEKAGEIIPQVVAVDVVRRPPHARRIVPPAVCPACGGPVRKDENGVYLRCQNRSCSAQFVERLRFFCARDQMDVEGAGIALIEALTSGDPPLVAGYADLFRLKDRRDELLKLERMGEKSVDNLLAGIEAAKKRPLSRLLAALAIPHVGSTTAELLAEQFGSLDAIAGADESQLQEIEGIGPEVAGSVRRWFQSEMGRRTIAELKSVGVDPVQPRRVIAADSPFAGQTVVVTGTLKSYSRAQIEDRLKALGAKVSGSVSRKTSFVVYGDEAGSKLEKARELGVATLSEEEFERLAGPYV